MAIDPQLLSGESCRDSREFIGMTQEQLAHAAKVSVATVRRLELGDLPIGDYAMRQIAEALTNEGIQFIGTRIPFER